MDMLTTLHTSAHQLGAIPDGTVQAVITSPPYYGLRSYAGEQDIEWPSVTYRLNEWCEPVTVQGCEPGCAHEWVTYAQKRGSGGEREYGSYDSGVGRGPAVKHPGHNFCPHCGGWRGPLGLEPSPVAYIGHLILCLREWRRVLRDDGVCFVNLGDSYAGSGGAGGDYNGGGIREGQPRWKSQFKAGETVKPKDLLGIPWMFAFAARADGWYLRSDVIWAKPNPMPESVTDRPTKAHEYVFLLAKSARYYWDADAVREKRTDSNTSRFAAIQSADWELGEEAPAFTPKARNPLNPYARQSAGIRGVPGVGTTWRTDPVGRNLRTVWQIATSPYPGAHYAVFPERLVEPMVKAGSSERGCCAQCGAPWRRVVEREWTKDDNGLGARQDTKQLTIKQKGGTSAFRTGGHFISTTTGWLPSCACDVGEPVPCAILDPFAGSGTTGRVAIKLGRRAILCDVSAEYLLDHVPDRTTVQMELLA